MSDSLKFTKSAIEWRRNTILSKLAKGYSQTEIAKELQLHPSTISLDVQYLKERAQLELETHIKEKIPLEYTRALTGINNILKKANETLDKATDTKTQLQTMGLLAELYKSIMSLATDGGIVEQAIKTIKQMQSQDATNIAANEEEPEGKQDFQDDEEPPPVEPEEDLKEE
jgi:IS30 family transposase